MKNTKTLYKKGHILTVHSSENDADYRNTRVLSGLSEEEVVSYVILLRELDVNPLCNNYNPGRDEVTEGLKPLVGILKKHFNESCTDDDQWEEAIQDRVGLLLGCSCDYYFRRLVSFEIMYLEKDVECQDVTGDINDLATSSLHFT